MTGTSHNPSPVAAGASSTEGALTARNGTPKHDLSAFPAVHALVSRFGNRPKLNAALAVLALILAVIIPLPFLPVLSSSVHLHIPKPVPLRAGQKVVQRKSWEAAA